MKLISHRGNTTGPDDSIENHPDRIKSILNRYDCEIDVWFFDEWFLGHDGPQYKVDYDFLRLPGLWIHAKNTKALETLITDEQINCFWHEHDSYTLTSRGFVWAYPDETCEVGNRTVAVMPEWNNTDVSNFFGVCTDYVKRYEQ